MENVYRRVARKGELAEDHMVCFYYVIDGKEERILRSDPRVIGYDEDFGELRTNVPLSA